MLAGVPMRKSLLLLILPMAASSAAPAAAQLLSERTEGLERVCTYAGSTNVTSDSAPRTHRVGMGQNCPLTPPAPAQGRLPPPSAELSDERLTEQGRSCIYGQGGASWTVALPSSHSCPLFAGMAGSDTQRAPVR